MQMARRVRGVVVERETPVVTRVAVEIEVGRERIL
jgi:hypothetical protein